MSNTFDDNRSVWAAGAPPGYVPRAALEGEIACDVAIVGGGFTGTSTAYHLARRDPSLRIVLCEARELASGASGRNGGLALNWVNGSGTEDLALATRVFEVTRAGIDAIGTRIREHRLDVPWRRDGYLDIVTDEARADATQREVERLVAAGLPLRFLRGAELEAFARFEGARGAVLDPTAGQLDGLRFVRAMRPVLEELGVTVFENTPVRYVDEDRVVTLRTAGGRVRARAIVLATNAYTPQLGYFGYGVVPLHSHVIATTPASPERWAELGWERTLGGFSDDYDRIAYGSMSARGELVFGGGSNAAYGYGFHNATAFRGDRGRPSRAIEESLHRYLPRLAGARDVRLAHRWSGPIALTMSRICTMGVRGRHQNVYFALGYSGHGVTLGNLAGEVLTDLYAGTAARWEGLPFFQQKLLFVPPEPFRWVGYQAYTRVTGRSPRRSS